MHGRRKFVDLYDRFEDQCGYVINALKAVYHNDEVARDKKLSADERLSYHQIHSQPTMDDLKKWLDRQFEEKRVEPNSALGDAISYLLGHWNAMTGTGMEIAGAFGIYFTGSEVSFAYPSCLLRSPSSPSDAKKNLDRLLPRFLPPFWCAADTRSMVNRLLSCGNPEVHP